MRTTKLWCLCAVLLVYSATFAVGQAQYEVLYTFGTNGGTNDGAGPQGKLLMDKAGNLIGTTRYGGNVATFPCFGSCGTVFELSPVGDGTWTESVLYDFCQDFDGIICLDGENPTAGLISDSSGNLYGTTISGGGDNCPYGGGGCGTVFELSPPNVPAQPWGYTLLYQFCQIPGDEDCIDGAWPYGKLTFDSSGNLYGTTSKGGRNGGVVFELSPSPNGWTESVLYTFCSGAKWPVCPDGSDPVAGVMFDKAGNLYGTTSEGGSPKFQGGGVAYKLSPSQGGWKETVLYAFPSAGGLKGGDLLGAVNFDPSGNLYGTAFSGGKSGLGGVFRLSPKNGGSETTFSFSGANGAAPASGVLIDPRNGNLYGTTSAGGSSGYGTVFRIAGKTETVIYSFMGSENGDGRVPMAALEADRKGHLYGTTKLGGEFDQGVVFEIIP